MIIKDIYKACLYPTKRKGDNTETRTVSKQCKSICIKTATWLPEKTLWGITLQKSLSASPLRYKNARQMLSLKDKCRIPFCHRNVSFTEQDKHIRDRWKNLAVEIQVYQEPRDQTHRTLWFAYCILLLSLLCLLRCFLTIIMLNNSIKKCV